VLGTGVQTARASLDARQIGAPVAATAFMVTPGHERWHPAPEFYYLPGGGPLLDMGPYYLTALVTLLGPVRRVTGMSATPRATRIIGSGPRAGAEFEVTVATHVTGVLEHANGALSTLMMSFDVWAGQLPRIEVYGTGGSLSVPDPNGFDGPVRIFRAEAEGWTSVAEAGGYRDAARGYGVSDLASALAAGTAHRANGELAYHVLDVMESLLAAAGSGTAVDLASSCGRPAGVPFGARPDRATASAGPPDRASLPSGVMMLRAASAAAMLRGNHGFRRGGAARGAGFAIGGAGRGRGRVRQRKQQLRERRRRLGHGFGGRAAAAVRVGGELGAAVGRADLHRRLDGLRRRL
jgi:hypothetical protein